MKRRNKTIGIALVIILIALVGIVIYGKSTTTPNKDIIPPQVKGPSTPPPGYEAR